MVNVNSFDGFDGTRAFITQHAKGLKKRDRIAAAGESHRNSCAVSAAGVKEIGLIGLAQTLGHTLSQRGEDFSLNRAKRKG